MLGMHRGSWDDAGDIEFVEMDKHNEGGDSVFKRHDVQSRTGSLCNFQIYCISTCEACTP
jgi:hypothetical protein